MTKSPGAICWLASFPKSGNTWARILLSNLVAEEQVDDDHFTALAGSISANRNGFDLAAGLASSDLTDDEIDLLRPAYYRALADGSDTRLFIKVHDGYHLTPGDEPLFPTACSYGAIYLVRHPFDVAVSYAHHLGHQNYDRVIAHLNDRAYAMAGHGKPQLRQQTLGWSGHYLSWHQQSDIVQLTIRYEDMVADTAACLLQMAEFLQLAEASDTAAIARAVEDSRFERLREKEEAFGFGERSEVSKRFFRKGSPGEGREVLSAEQRTAIYAANRDVMDLLGYRP